METGGNAATVNPLIIIIRGVVGGHELTVVVLVIARAALHYYVTTLLMHAHAMQREDGKPLGLGRRDKVASPGPSFPIIRTWRSASLDMHTKQYL